MSKESLLIKKNTRPLSLLAVDALQNLIHREYSPEDQLPSEAELGEMLGVSRSTLRVALGILEQKGLISRKSGVGTFVSSSPTDMLSGGLQFLQSLKTLAEKEGLPSSMADFEISHVSANKTLAGTLRVAQGTDLISIKYKILIKELPVVSIDTIARKEHVNLKMLNASDYAFPEAYSSLSYTHSKIFAINADLKIADALKVEPHNALLHLLETYYSTDGKPIAVSYNYFVTERFNFYIGRLLNK